MIQMTLHLLAEPDRSRCILTGLRSMARSAKLERGCLRSRISVDADDSRLMYYVEEWDSADELDGQIRSERFTRLLAIAEAASAPPDLQFRFIHDIRGLDYVAVQRG